MRYLISGLMALASPAALHAQPTPAAAPQFGIINFRLDVAPDQVAEMQAGLAKIPNARIAEPADYMLTTKQDFPQTPLVVDAHDSSRTIEAGNLIDGSYVDKISEIVRKAMIGKPLLGLSRSSGPIQICLQPSSFDGPPPDSIDLCHSGALPASKADPDGMPDTNFIASFSAATIRNQGSKPVYVALLLVDSTFAVHRIELDGQQPLAPGASIQGKGPPFEIPSGLYRLVALWSDHPLGTDAGVTGTLGAGVSASFAEYLSVETPVGEMSGGWAASLTSAPWMAQIYSTYEYTAADLAEDAKKPRDEREFMTDLTDVQRAHRCGGTLIATNLVVTAAHCVAKDNFAGAKMRNVLKMRRVRLGTTLLGSGGGTYAIVGLTVPATYNPDTHENDIALLLLAPDRDTGDVRQRTIKLATTPLVANAPLASFGWGFTEAATGSLRESLSGEIQRSPDDLQEGAFKAMPLRQCQHAYGDQLKPGMVCVSGRGRTHVFTCLGDSGGPLVRGSGRQQELIGVTSWADGCGLPGKPDVFTDVSRQTAWIEAARKVLVPGYAQAFPPKSQPAANASARP